MAAHWIVGVDVGGTFTDLYAFDALTGRVVLHKRPSTPQNPADAILSGVQEIAGKAGFDTAEIAIQRKGAPVAVVTTKNFKDLLEIGRQVRPRLYDLKADNPAPLAAREHRFEVDERMGPDGAVLKPVDRDSLAEAIEALRASEVEACAVCFLFSYLNPDHEREVGEAIRQALPHIKVSLSSQVHPAAPSPGRGSTGRVRRTARALRGPLVHRAPTIALSPFQASEWTKSG
jgi:N-methylhydantoinase A